MKTITTHKHKESGHSCPDRSIARWWTGVSTLLIALTGFIYAQELGITDVSTPAVVKSSPVALEIQALTKTIRDQEDVVAEFRKILATIKKAKKIIHRDEEARTEQVSSEDQLHEKQYADLENRIGEIELNLDRLRYLEGEDLFKAAKQMTVKDNPFQKTNSQLNADQKLDELKRLLEKELQVANEEIRKIPLKRAFYSNVNARYKNEMERLKLMKGAMSRLEKKQSEQ